MPILQISHIILCGWGGGKVSVNDSEDTGMNEVTRRLLLEAQ